MRYGYRVKPYQYACVTVTPGGTRLNQNFVTQQQFDSWWAVVEKQGWTVVSKNINLRKVCRPIPYWER